jgi:membrane fusion protein, heavy metal efflux system
MAANRAYLAHFRAFDNPELSVITNHRKRLPLMLGGAGVLILIGALAFHLRKPAPAAAPAASVAAVASVDQTPALPDTVDLSPEALANVKPQVVPAQIRQGVHTISATGVVAFNAKQLVQLRSPSRGRIVAMDVAVGDRVRAGQRLAVLDQFDLSDVQSQVAGALAAVTDAKTAALAAEAALARGTELVAVGGIAQSELERRRAAAANAEALLKQREADLQKWQGMQQRLLPIASMGKANSVGANLAQLSPRNSLGALIAPFDGVITAVSAATGEIADTTAPVVTLTNLSTMWVLANVSQRDAADLRVGDAANLRIDAYGERRFSGRVIDVANQVDPSTGMVAVRAEVPNADGALRANMFATVEIEAPLDHDSVLVPDAALQDVNGKSVVFVPTGNGHFAWHAVQTGSASGGMTEIVSGLAAQTPVVTDGSYWLKTALLSDSIPSED